MASNSGAAIRVAETNSIPEINNVSKLQVSFICDSFKLANSENRPDKALEPMIIRRDGIRLPSGYANLIELHGYYTKETVESAIFQLKDEGLLPDIITQMVTDDDGIVKQIQFIRPLMRMRLASN